ncbi:MATE family efflux transporter [Anaerolentibacter hominis]|uniref:MATE family efflux transporter n=1 Tax=Anaerolentibacter hominis TaxID=3079009 RepID=UPI0031B837FF
MGEQKGALLFSNKNLYKLILPLIIEQVLTVTVGMADSIMIASVGEAAVSGVSLVDTVNVLLINVFSALATGGAVVAGQFIGSRKKELACKSADQLLMFVTGLAVAVMLLVYAGKYFILHVVFGQIAPDVMGHANTYLLIVSMSIPFIALYNAGAALFRAMGNSRISMATSLIMNLVNIAGNAILIYGVKLGVAGAAIPTLVSRILASIIIVALLRDPTLTIHISRPFRFKLDFTLIKRILRIGIPNGLENSMFQLGKILVLSLVAGFGTASIAANAVSNTVCQFQILPGMAIGLAMITVVSQCVGAGDYEQVRYNTKKLLKITHMALVVTNGIIFLILPFILKAYNLSPETAQMARDILIFHGSCSIFIWPISFTLPNALRASSDVKYTMVISILSMWIFRIGFSYIIGKVLGLGVFGVWVAMVIDWVFRSICFVIRYRGHKWELLRNS